MNLRNTKVCDLCNFFTFLQKLLPLVLFCGFALKCLRLATRSSLSTDPGMLYDEISASWDRWEHKAVQERPPALSAGMEAPVLSAPPTQVYTHRK